MTSGDFGSGISQPQPTQRKPFTLRDSLLNYSSQDDFGQSRGPPGKWIDRSLKLGLVIFLLLKQNT